MPPETPAPVAPTTTPAAPTAAPAQPTTAAPSGGSPAPAPAPAAPTRPKWEEDLDKLGDEPAKPAGTAEPAGGKKAAAPTTPAPASDEHEEEGVKIPKGVTLPKEPKFRAWALGGYKQAKQLETEKAQLEAKVKQLESVVPRTQEDSRVLNERITSLQGLVTQYEQALATHVFERSPKYVNEYQKPYAEARQQAYEEVEQLMVTFDTGERDSEGTPVTKQRPANRRDFDFIYSLPRAQARQAAKKMFGDDADDVMQLRKNVADLAEKAIKAVQEHEKNYKDEAKKTYEQTRVQRSALDGLWKTVNDRISSDPKRALYWGTDNDDPDANTALTKGFQIADLFFSEERDKMTPEDRVAFDANIRHRIAGFSKLAHKVRVLADQVAAKDAEIAQLRGSAPGRPSVSGETTPGGSKTWQEGIDALPE